MAIKKAFISFDAEHDDDLRNLLAGQAKYTASPFEFENWSVKEKITGDWKKKVRTQIKRTDLTIVICGEHTDKATGVATELTITQEEKKPYFLLKGRPDKTCKKPTTAKTTDKIYKWTWDNLKALIDGAR